MKDRTYYLVEKLKYSALVIVIASIVALANQCFGQDVEKKVIVNGTNINTLPDIEFVEIVGVQLPLSQKLNVVVYHGQQMKLGDDQRIEGSDGKAIKFFGMVDALNFMYKNGWEFVNAYAITISNQNVYHYLLRKKKN